jgi:hypothetical protein
MRKGSFRGARDTSHFFFLLFCTVLICFDRQPAVALDEPPPNSLEAYLIRLGYAPIVLRTDRANRPVVDAQLAGKKRTFLVDTGCGITRLRDTIAGDSKKLSATGIQLSDPVLGLLTNSSMVIMEMLILGKAQFLNQPAILSELKADFVRVLYDGILGCDFLIRNHCLVDCAGNRLYVRGGPASADVSSALGKSLALSGYVEVPIEDQGVLAVSGKANGQKLTLLVDTGSWGSILDDSLKVPLGLSPVKWKEAFTGSLIPEEVKALTIGAGKIGAHEMTVAKLITLELGDKKWTAIHVGLADLSGWGVGDSGKPENVQGFLGIELIRRSGALIDFSKRKLWMLREEKSPVK